MSDQNDSDRNEDEPTVGEQIGEAIRSEDEPIEESEPAAPLAMTMGTYPIVLIVLLILVAAAVYFMAWRESEPANPAEIPAGEMVDQ